MKAFLKDLFGSLKSTIKWILIFLIISFIGILAAVVPGQVAAYQAVAHQVAQQQAAKVKGGLK
ncbi:MAG: hypothetical protein ACYDCF_08240 [Burkholderiales bacterium]